MGAVRFGMSFRDGVAEIADAPVFLRAVWRNVRGLGLSADDALVSLVVGAKSTAPDYVIREVMEGTADDPHGAISHGPFSGITHRAKRVAVEPETAEEISLNALKVILAHKINKG
ncbi:hypothetical protein WH87_17075 [Devosia epidermidihirudinis]|uniref:Uncharacterized protein n=1 Tax=Devosia epidermidihirudinis TaxID=1293439 RepID=A0A0F5Q321_9HYPH|nr:hypothetical protein [Devosia epidermidihirudinis]KKC35297.1 hypothetical protein WH87_17075 [Devosia epidermidihirudinis]